MFLIICDHLNDVACLMIYTILTLLQQFVQTEVSIRDKTDPDIIVYMTDIPSSIEPMNQIFVNLRSYDGIHCIQQFLQQLPSIANMARMKQIHSRTTDIVF